jgi:nicotinamide riboside kinase
MEENLEQQPTNLIKIAFFGPESTGKSTLAAQLATAFHTISVPEFARAYLQEKWDKTKTICQPSDLLPIAIGQIQSENHSLKNANKILFCDTNLLVTKTYSEIYYGFCDPILDQAAKKHEYDLFFLTDIDVPWEKDDLRDKPTEREAVFRKFESELIENNKPFLLISGDKNTRLNAAIAIINDLIKAKNMEFTSQDFIQIKKHGLSIDKIENQIEIFKNGIAKTILEKPVTTDNGMLHFSEKDFQELAILFDTKKTNLKLKKFVPASGAASRMFQFLNEFLNNFNPEDETINAYINKNNAVELTTFLAGLEKFPFFKDIDSQLHNDFNDFKTWERDAKNYQFIKYLIGAEFLDYANKPKAVLPFHKYQNHIATPIEEHLIESAFYANANGEANLHFTVSDTHQSAFEAILDDVKNKVETEFKTKINIRFSYQDKATDTIAVDKKNKPFRDGNGNLVFRPGGHGALIDNLNNLDADIIFIKNIDNVIQNHIEQIALYKKALAGNLLQLQEQIFDYLNQMDANGFDENHLSRLIEFVEKDLKIIITDHFHNYSFEAKTAYLKQILNRPIRVCGMVKNEGEPGGGPFWVKDKKGNLSMQIVESSQVDLENKTQADILASSTHFNPVDLVCGIKNHRGEKFNLIDFIDQQSGFIVHKNSKGKALKGYELPGLWNGAMANWITIFVEVPIITFNPVKTVNDLLKPTHQEG